MHSVQSVFIFPYCIDFYRKLQVNITPNMVKKLDLAFKAYKDAPTQSPVRSNSGHTWLRLLIRAYHLSDAGAHCPLCHLYK